MPQKVSVAHVPQKNAIHEVMEDRVLRWHMLVNELGRKPESITEMHDFHSRSN